MQRQLSRSISASSQPAAAGGLPGVGDSAIKLKLLEFYIVSEEHSGLLTIKEVQDWALENGFDKNKVKQVNQ